MIKFVKKRIQYLSQALALEATLKSLKLCQTVNIDTRKSLFSNCSSRVTSASSEAIFITSLNSRQTQFNSYCSFAINFNEMAGAISLIISLANKYQKVTGQLKI